jgi:hypothetical protein
MQVRLFMNCPECERLWLEYQQAVKSHLKAVREWPVAAVGKDSGLIDSLERLLRQALERHTVTSKAFRAHAATHTEQE